MPFKNNRLRYGFVSIAMHWLVALAVLVLFGLGLWMTDLSYYSPWYHKAPTLHMTIGMAVFAVMIFRLLWRFISPVPQALSSHSKTVQRLSKAGHLALYLLLFTVLIAGYLIFTADGDAIVLLGGFEIPALIHDLPDQADIAGVVHLYGAWLLITLAAGHALASLKHHFVDKDATLKRMLP